MVADTECPPFFKISVSAPDSCNKLCGNLVVAINLIKGRTATKANFIHCNVTQNSKHGNYENISNPRKKAKLAQKWKSCRQVSKVKDIELESIFKEK